VAQEAVFSSVKEIAMPCHVRVLAPVAAWILASASLASQSAGPSAEQLAALLDRGRLDSVAARVPGSEDRFVAALYTPGQHLILVSGRYAAPTLLREKLLGKRYREVYQDLYGASDPATRLVIEDLRADGLQPDREKDGPFDVYTPAGGEPVFFDGEWKRHKLSEDAYRDAFRQAEAAYDEMIGVLVGALTEPTGSQQPTARTASSVP